MFLRPDLRLSRNSSILNNVQKRFFQLTLLALMTILTMRLLIQTQDADITLSTTEYIIRSTLFLLGLVVIYLLNYDRYTDLLSHIVIAMLLVATVRQSNVLIYLILLPPLIISTALFASNPLLIAIVLGLCLKLVDFNGDFVNTVNQSIEGFDIAIMILLITSSTAILRYFAINVESITERATRSTNLLHATSDVGQITNKLLDLDELFTKAVELIRDRFAYYHVQVFLIDNQREYAELVASTGDVGKQLIDLGHKLAVGSQSVIGKVTQVGEPVVAGDADSDNVHARNELLPNTRSELALPIIDGDRIIGALDVQSTRSKAFNDTDIQALQVMANQLAVAIRNARLFEAKEASLQENRRLFGELEGRLDEIERLNQQLTRRAWQDYLQGDNRTSGITLGDQGISEDNTAWSATMIEAHKTRRTTHQQHDNLMTIAVPIILRGEVLGVVEVETESELRQSDIVETMKTVAERLAISLDNSRLFQEAQETTAQEQRINDIVGKYQSASTVDDLLEITLAELSESLGAQSSSIRLTSSQTTANTNGSNGHQNGFRKDKDNGA